MMPDYSTDTLTDLADAFIEFDPIKYLGLTGAPLGFENVYQLIQPQTIDKEKPIVFVVIGPSGSGKDTLVDFLVEHEMAAKVRTATTRKRREKESEPENAYTWMRERDDDEPEEEYFSNLIEEYDLIEHDIHNGYLYGLPQDNLTNAHTNKPLVIRTESKGLDTITEGLGNDVNLISIFVTAESYDVLLKRIEARENVGLRMRKAVDEVRDAKDKVNFVILNKEDDLSNPFTADIKAYEAKMAIKNLMYHLLGKISEV